jgi:hypothetical protein
MKNTTFAMERDRDTKATNKTDESKTTKQMRYLYRDTLTLRLRKVAFSPQAYVDCPFSVLTDFGDR